MHWPLGWATWVGQKVAAMYQMEKQLAQGCASRKAVGLNLFIKNYFLAFCVPSLRIVMSLMCEITQMSTVFPYYTYLPIIKRARSRATN